MTRALGGFVQWLLKGCKTSLRDEVEGDLDASYCIITFSISDDRILNDLPM